MLLPGYEPGVSVIVIRIRVAYVLCCFAWLGCGHRAASPAATAPAPVVPTVLGPAPSAAAPPELIELRLLTVAYAGARGAPAEQQRTREQAAARAKMLASMARGGERLAQLVMEYSDRAGAAEDRGVMRVRPDGSSPLSPELVRKALALPVGSISDPLEQPEGFVIVERLPDPPLGPASIAAQHILIGYAGSTKELPSVTRSEAEARSLAEQVATEARQPGSDWNELANRYTDEPGGRSRAGDLGKFTRGQMVPPFEQAAFALKVGEISGVVKTPFGFHIIRRYE